MDAQFFLRGCWKRREEKDTEQGCIETVKTIREVLKIAVSPDVMLTMILSVILPEVCAKSTYERIVEDESIREKSNSETVEIIRVMCSAPLKARLVKYMCLVVTLPAAHVESLLDDMRRAEAEMTPPPARMTLLQGPSCGQEAGTFEKMTP